MKMKFHAALAVAATTLLAACSSNQPVPAPVADCVFADGSGEPAPEWVCGTEPAMDLTAVGYADKSGAGPNFMKQMAATAARVELAQTMRLDVQNMIKQYAETTGAADSETVDMVNTSVTKQLTKETLVGSKIIHQRPTPTGGMVVMVGLDADSITQVTEQALKTSMNNDRALWQKFQADKSFDEMASDIANMDR
ncbi:MAG: hypothetical protein CMI08_18445 [Oceanospirillaceae bacterium]|nr:hypothetical protein [Oceanospirillaceae bacterium]MAY01145.1 hypothetical protein [Oceanospirillaceae bacterium]MBL36475.1 hypothetical protein [Oceanospirillaceae bacterium]MBS52160.1 hypothetical protein [Oceanospirillaceae bacterium]